MLLRRLLIFLSQQVISVWTLKCLTGHPSAPTVCSSLSYCVTVKSPRGPIQRSCDGNGLNQVSLCSMNQALRRQQSIPSDFATYSDSSRHSSSQARYSVASTQQMCSNAGEFGEICCCQWEFCNASPRSSWFPAGLLLIFTIYFYYTAYL